MLTLSTIMWFFGISAFQVLAGVLIGWWLRSAKRNGGSATADLLTKHLTDALGRVQRLAGDMSLDASQHAEKVEAAGKRINAAAEMGVDQLHQTLLDGMSQIMAANNRLQNQLTDVESKLEDQSRQIETQLAEARIDAVTGVANRRAFGEELARRLAEWRRRHTPMSLMLVDIDHFKKINDSYGHPTGDAVLRETARTLQHTMREMDFTARFGGEEFAVIFPATALNDARRAAQRALAAVERHVTEQHGHEIKVTISVGVSEALPGDDADTLVRRADEALYLSKAAGRNCGHYHSGGEFALLESPRILDATSSLTAPPPVAIVAPAAAKEASPRRTVAHDTSLDALTDLPAAQSFATELRRRVQRARTDNLPLALVLVDIDRLASINEREGHAGGDAVLRRVADLLRNVGRDCDFVARYHEGQFALVLSSATLPEATAAAERLCNTMRTAAHHHGPTSIEATVSCGVAALEPSDRSVSLVMRASRALAAAKSAGRDSVFVHDGRTVEPAEETAAS